MFRRYYKRTLSYSRIRFVLETALLSIVGKLGVGLLLFSLYYLMYGVELPDPLKNEEWLYNDWELIGLVGSMVIVLPFLETFTQWISISLLKKVTNNYLLVILGTGALFASLHWSYSVWYAVMIFPLGLALAWSFYCRQKKSLVDAFMTTFYVHAAHNLVGVVFIFFRA